MTNCCLCPIREVPRALELFSTDTELKSVVFPQCDNTSTAGGVVITCYISTYTGS